MKQWFETTESLIETNDDIPSGEFIEFQARKSDFFSITSNVLTTYSKQITQIKLLIVSYFSLFCIFEILIKLFIPVFL